MITACPISAISPRPPVAESPLQTVGLLSHSRAFRRCLKELAPLVHTANQSMAAGTAFGLSYEVYFSLVHLSSTQFTRISQSDISKVTPDNTVVITVRYQ